MKYIQLIFFFLIMLFSTNLYADSTQTDNFNSNLEGWSGDGVSRTNKDGSQRMRIDRDKTATKTFSFGASYTNAEVTLTFSLLLDDDWETSDDVYIIANGTTVATYNHTDGTYSKTITASTDASGDIELKFRTDTSANGERAYFDNISVTALSPKVPIAEYRMDECLWDGSANQVLDNTGSIHGQSINNAAIDTTGKICHSGTFDGTDSDYKTFNGDYVTVGDNFNNIFGGNNDKFTITTWLKPASLGSERSNHYTRNTFFAKSSDSKNDNIEIGITTAGELHLYLQTDDKNGYDDFGSGITVGSWHFIAVVYDGNDLRITIDGTTTTDNRWGGDIANAVGSPITFGGNLHIKTYFNGQMDEVKIYDEALSSTEISAIYTNENSGKRYDGSTAICQICTPNTAPVADAGADQNIDTNTLVTLDASGSSDADGDTLTYQWAFSSRPAGSSATLNNPTSITPTFTPDIDGSYVLTLVVNDGTIDSPSDSVTITATPHISIGCDDSLDTNANSSSPGITVIGMDGITTDTTDCISGTSDQAEGSPTKEDYYKFTVNASGTLNITTSSPNSHSYHLTIGSTANGDEYYTDTKAAIHTISSIALNSGDTVYLKIKETGSDLDAYEINFEFIVTPPLTCSTTPSGIIGKYRNGSNFTGTVDASRTDSQINFNWGSGSPIGGINSDNFTVVWYGTILVPEDANYVFSMQNDDRATIRINGNEIYDEGYTSTNYRDSNSIYLRRGEHTIRVTLQENSGGARIHLRWRNDVSFPTDTIISSSNFCQEFISNVPINEGVGDCPTSYFRDELDLPDPAGYVIGDSPANGWEFFAREGTNVSEFDAAFGGYISTLKPFSDPSSASGNESMFLQRLVRSDNFYESIGLGKTTYTIAGHPNETVPIRVKWCDFTPWDTDPTSSFYDHFHDYAKITANGVVVTQDFDYASGTDCQTLEFNATTNSSSQINMEFQPITNKDQESMYVQWIDICNPVPATAPIMGDVPNQTLHVSDTLTVDIASYVTPTEGDPILSYSLSCNPNIPLGTAFNTSTGLLNGAPTAVGTYTCQTFATDKDGDSNDDNFTIAVTNNPPTFTSIPVTTVDVINPYSYSVTTTDPDGDLVTVTATTLPTWLTFDGFTLTGTAPSNTGVHQVVLHADDGNGGISTQTFDINVTEIITPPPPPTSTKDKDHICLRTIHRWYLPVNPSGFNDFTISDVAVLEGVEDVTNITIRQLLKNFDTLSPNIYNTKLFLGATFAGEATFSSDYKLLSDPSYTDIFPKTIIEDNPDNGDSDYRAHILSNYDISALTDITSLPLYSSPADWKDGIVYNIPSINHGQKRFLTFGISGYDTTLRPFVLQYLFESRLFIADYTDSNGVDYESIMIGSCTREANITDTSAQAGTTMKVPVNIQGANPEIDLYIPYHTEDDTAIAGSDYESASGTIIIPAGTTLPTTYYIDVVIKPNALPSQFNILIDSATAITIIDGIAIGTILNPDYPTAYAGPDQTVYIGDNLTFNGSASGNNTPFTYSWDFIDTAPGKPIGDRHFGDTTTVTISAEGAPPGTYPVTFTVTDTKGHVATDIVMITLLEQPKQDPIAIAGDDTSIVIGSDIILNGGASYDPDGGSITEYTWSENGSVISTGVTPTISGLTDGNHTITLVVKDDENVTSVGDDIIISVVNIVDNADDLCYYDPTYGGPNGTFFSGCVNFGPFQGGFNCQQNIEILNKNGIDTLQNVTVAIDTRIFSGSFVSVCGIDLGENAETCDQDNLIDFGPLHIFGQNIIYALNNMGPNDNDVIWEYSAFSGSVLPGAIFRGDNLYGSYTKNGTEYKAKLKKCTVDIDNANDICIDETQYVPSSDYLGFCVQFGPFFQGGFNCKQKFKLRSTEPTFDLTNVRIAFDTSLFSGKFFGKCGFEGINDGSPQDGGEYCHPDQAINFGPVAMGGKNITYNLNYMTPSDVDWIWEYALMSMSIFQGDNLYGSYIKDTKLYGGKILDCNPIPHAHDLCLTNITHKGFFFFFPKDTYYVKSLADLTDVEAAINTTGFTFTFGGKCGVNDIRGEGLDINQEGACRELNGGNFGPFSFMQQGIRYNLKDNMPTNDTQNFFYQALFDMSFFSFNLLNGSYTKNGERYAGPISDCRTTNNAPNADAGPDQTIIQGQGFTLNGANSSDSDGGIVQYQWTDGTNHWFGAVPFVNTTGWALGDHIITLTVTDNLGATDSDTVTITIIEPSATIDIPNQTADIYKTFTLDATNYTSNPDGYAIKYGLIDTDYTNFPLTIDPNTGVLTGTPTAIANYSVTVMIYNDYGILDDDTFIISVQDRPIASDNDYNTTKGYAISGNLMTDDTGDGVDTGTGIKAIAKTKVRTTYGFFTLDTNGSFTYIPDHNATGTDTFTYKIEDINGFTSDLATVSIEIIEDTRKYKPSKPHAFETRFNAYLPGDLVAIGNSNICADDDKDAICDANQLKRNDTSNIIYINKFSSPAVASEPDYLENTTAATLSLPVGAKVKWAGLYWQGEVWNFWEGQANLTNANGVDTGTDGQALLAKADKIQFKSPVDSSYSELDAQEYYYFNLKRQVGNIAKNKISETYGYGYGTNYGYDSTHAFSFTEKQRYENHYQGFIDMTARLQAVEASNGGTANGEYWVGNIQATLGEIRYPGVEAAWTLQVVYELPDADTRSITVTDGYVGLYGSAQDGVNYSKVFGYPEDSVSTGVYAYDVNFDVNGLLTPTVSGFKTDMTIFVTESDPDTGVDTSLPEQLRITKKDGSIYSVDPLQGQPLGDAWKYEILDKTGNNITARKPAYVYPIGMTIKNYRMTDALSTKQTSTNVKFSTDSDRLILGVIGFATDLHIPDVCYDYTVDIGGYVIDSTDNIIDTPFSFNTSLPLITRVSLQSLDGDFDLEDANISYKINKTTELKYISGSTAIAPDAVFNYLPATSQTPIETPSGFEMYLGEGATNNHGGVLKPGENHYIRFENELQKSDINTSFELIAHYNVQFNGTVVPLQTRLTKFCKDATGSYTPAYGIFNVVSADANNVGLPYNIQTQVANRPFDIKIFSYDNNFTNLLDANTSVELELFNVYFTRDVNLSCLNPDSNISYPSFVDFNQTNMVRIDDVSFPLAVRNAGFRVWKLQKPDGALANHHCSNRNWQGCFQTLYTKVYAGIDTVCNVDTDLDGDRECIDGTGADCYTCLRQYYGQPICSRDNFAIRPEAFVTYISDSNESKDLNQTNLIGLAHSTSFAPSLGTNANLIAGYQYRFDVNATNYTNNNAVIGYKQQFLNNTPNILSSFTWSPNGHDVSECNDTNDTNLSAMTMSDGTNIINKQAYTARVEQIGKYQFSLYDVNWTAVDWDDQLLKHHLASNFSSDLDDCVKTNPQNPDGNKVPTEGKVGCAISSQHQKSNSAEEYFPIDIRYYPYTFNSSNLVTGAGVNNIMQNTIVYINTLDDENDMMSFNIEGTFNALSFNNIPLSNFTSGCYADDTEMITSYTYHSEIPSTTPKLNYSLINRDTNTSTKIRDEYQTLTDTPILNQESNITISQFVSDFVPNMNGGLHSHIGLNFNRTNNTPLNPRLINFGKFWIKDTSAPILTVNLNSNYSIEFENPIDQNITFVYGRAKPTKILYDDITQESIQTSVLATLYCDLNITECQDRGLLLLNAQTNESSWWKSLTHNTPDDGNIVIKLGTLKGTGSASVENNSSALEPISLNITSPDASDNSIIVRKLSKESYSLLVPIVLETDSTKIEFTDPWLIYNPDHATNDPKELFKVRFIGNPSWSGVGKRGSVVEFESSSNKKSNRMDW